MPFVVEPMRLEDIREVTAIERQSFSTPWPEYAYRREIKDNRNSRYIVVRWVDEPGQASMPLAVPTIASLQEAPPPVGEPSLLSRIIGHLRPFVARPRAGTGREEHREGTLVGYAGLWLIHDEGHVTTIAVRPDARGVGVGELMLVRLVELAQEMGAKRLTLEVRVSNEVAQNLYRKYTFQTEGVRRRYYSDDNEDALIMWSEAIDSAGFQSRFAELRSKLIRKYGKRLTPWWDSPAI